jgi:hypothetical protein
MQHTFLPVAREKEREIRSVTKSKQQCIKRKKEKKKSSPVDEILPL